MATLSVLKFDDPYGADRVLVALQGIQERVIGLALMVFDFRPWDRGADSTTAVHKRWVVYIP